MEIHNLIRLKVPGVSQRVRLNVHYAVGFHFSHFSPGQVTPPFEVRRVDRLFGRIVEIWTAFGSGVDELRNDKYGRLEPIFFKNRIAVHPIIEVSVVKREDDWSNGQQGVETQMGMKVPKGNCGVAVTREVRQAAFEL